VYGRTVSLESEVGHLITASIQKRGVRGPGGGTGNWANLVSWAEKFLSEDL